MSDRRQGRSASAQPRDGGAKSGGTATRAGSGNSGGTPGQGGNGTRQGNGRAHGVRDQRTRSPGTRSQGRYQSTQARAGAQAAASPTVRAGTRYGAPLWLQLTALALSLAGLGVSIYLTVAHYTSSSILACSDNGLVNCAKVTTSPESIIFGIFPVAVLGLAFYVFMVAINTPWAWRSQLPAIWWARLGGIVVGMAFVLYLVYAEIIEIGNICLWCTSVHVITLLLFAVLVFGASLRSGARAAAKPAR